MLLLYILGMIGSMTGMNGSDGIIVSPGENISIIEGEWTLLLTIHEDGIAHRLVTHAELVERTRKLRNTIIDVQNIGAFFTRAKKALMRAKLTWS